MSRAMPGSRPDGSADGQGIARPDRQGRIMEWVRAQPVLTAAVVGFCVVSIAGLFVMLPPGMFSAGRTARGSAMSVPAARTSDAPPASARRGPETPSAGEAPALTPESPQPGPWVHSEPSPASPRGASLVYHYRTLPPGGESRYEWVVQVRGPQPLLDGVEVVSWRMDPPAKNGADFTSRDRAADGFPLFGHGPGGWFGVSAQIRYRDGVEEALGYRIELSE